MDFVYDLTDKLEEQKIDFFLVTIRTGVKSDAADVFYHFKDEASIESLVDVLHKLEQTPDLGYIKNTKRNELENDTSKKNAENTRGRRRSRKTTPKKKRPPRRRKKNGDE